MPRDAARKRVRRQSDPPIRAAVAGPQTVCPQRAYLVGEGDHGGGHAVDSDEDNGVAIVLQGEPPRHVLVAQVGAVPCRQEGLLADEHLHGGARRIGAIGDPSGRCNQPCGSFLPFEILPESALAIGAATLAAASWVFLALV